MAYDFETDVRNLTRADTLAIGVINWAIALAKTVYICGNSSDYDDTVSDADNFLVSILSSAFVTMYLNGSDLPSSFQLDELQLEFDTSAGAPEKKFFEMFFFWVKRFQAAGCDLQYADASTLMDVTTFTEPSVIASLTLPDNFE